jgi:hypothetical protein
MIAVRVQAIVAGLALLISTPQSLRVLRPVDEASRDPSFAAFRGRLLSVIAKRDADALLRVVAPDVLTSFGPESGIGAFRATWHPERNDSEVWPTLRRALELGGSFVGNEFCAPYVSSAFPDDLDGFTSAVVISPHAPLRASPRPQASVIAYLANEIVEVQPGSLDEGGGWVAVIRTAAPRRGYVARRYLRSPIDYRACFARGPNGWRMTSFVAGD